MCAVILTGCKSTPKPAVAPEGSSSFRVSDGIAARHRDPVVGPVVDGKLETGETLHEYIVPAGLSGIAQPPVYPASALRARAGLVVVAVRLTIGPDGKLQEIAPNPMAFSTPTKYADDFNAAIETAVRAWNFRPAYIHRTNRKQGRDGKMYRVPAPKETIEWVIDVSFTFNADGRVFGGGEPGM